MDNDLAYKLVKPDKSISGFVESFWYLHNRSDSDKETIGLPDGLVDLFLVQSPEGSFRIVLIGVGTEPHERGIIPAYSLRFAISFKLPAVEYLLQQPIADIVNDGKSLPAGFWDFNADDLNDFDAFCRKATQKILSLLPGETDSRKQQLFDLIYASKGSITVKKLSEKAFWSSRQINRYFNQQFGVSLKTYCKILRFRASLDHIAEGKLFPEENFADQTHFIREIKKFSGVVPKELLKNKNDRFILLSAIAAK